VNCVRTDLWGCRRATAGTTRKQEQGRERPRLRGLKSGERKEVVRPNLRRIIMKTHRHLAAAALVSLAALTELNAVVTITRQPTNQWVSLGANATLAVTATSTNPPLTYQWWGGRRAPGRPNQPHLRPHQHPTQSGRRLLRRRLRRRQSASPKCHRHDHRRFHVHQDHERSTRSGRGTERKRHVVGPRHRRLPGCLCPQCRTSRARARGQAIVALMFHQVEESRDGRDELPLPGGEDQRGPPQAAHALCLRQSSAFLIVDEQEVSVGLDSQADGLGFTRIRLREQSAEALGIRHAMHDATRRDYAMMRLHLNERCPNQLCAERQLSYPRRRNFRRHLYNCTLTGNRADMGGGATGGVLFNCRFTKNSAGQAGGAMFSKPRFDH